MPTVSKTDNTGKDENEELNFEFKKNKGEVIVVLKTRTKKPQGNWSDPTSPEYRWR
jgi:hypothetical protein